jgi:hypothetical protein
LKNTVLTPDETEEQRKRRKTTKRKPVSHFNAEIRRKVAAEVVAHDPDKETKADGPPERPSDMSITEG